MNKSRGRFCFVASAKSLMCFFTEIIKINRSSIKHTIVYEFYVTVKVIKSKLIIVIMKERKGFRAHVLVHNFLNALKSLGGSAAMLIFQDSFGLLNYVYTSMYVCVVYVSI